jgi:hypothetical protein
MKSTTAWQNRIVGHADVAPDEVLAVIHEYVIDR